MALALVEGVPIHVTQKVYDEVEDMTEILDRILKQQGWVSLLKWTVPDTIIPGAPATALAPMQDVTDKPFMDVIAGYGPPDFFTSFSRAWAL